MEKEITIYEWQDEMTASIAKFVEWWKEHQEADSDNYPMKMLPGDWDEQFSLLTVWRSMLTMMSEQGKLCAEVGRVLIARPMPHRPHRLLLARVRMVREYSDAMQMTARSLRKAFEELNHKRKRNSKKH